MNDIKKKWQKNVKEIKSIIFAIFLRINLSQEEVAL